MYTTVSEMPTLRRWLEADTFTLALSSGYFGFFAHAGVLLALEENGLMPTVVSGASGGALAGGCWAAGCSAVYLRELLFELKRDDFWDPSLGVGLLKGERFRQYVDNVTPVSNIEQCRVPLRISAFDVYTRSTHVLEQGSLSDGIYASCVVPFLFHPIRINNRLYLDGGIRDQSGLAGTSDNARILSHHIPPQRRANPQYFMQLPQRKNMVTLIVHGLQRVNPFQLGNGRVALIQGYRAMTSALDRAIDQQQIHVRQS